ncbi:MAG TPA: type II toxin-antitoxin system VapC family toxin [Polyangiaceae bacterium]|nr:type II toxin-antitoxin system VapC family toxin [Polyangiaceae bacterium]
MSADIVLDTNVLVAWLDEHDSLAKRASGLLERIAQQGDRPVLIDVAVAEALSVLARRAAERKTNPPSLEKVLERIRAWLATGDIAFVGHHSERLFSSVLDVVAESSGKLNFNDALLVALQREGTIGGIASFDSDFDTVPGFRRLG